jgi:tetratricopeptide (TPR) repeat protein
MAKPKDRKKLWTYLIVLVVAGAILLPVAYQTARHLLWQRVLGWRRDGLAAAKANDVATATDLLERYLKRDPRDLEVLEVYAHCLEQKELAGAQNAVQTISTLRIILELDPTRLDDRRHLLDLYVRMDRRPEAMDMADAILAKLPKDARTLGIKTQLLADMNQDAAALDLAQQWVLAAPGELAPQMARISARFRLGQPADQIIADVQSVQAARPDDARAQLLLGFAYTQAGRRADAATWLNAAAKHAEDNPEFIETLVSQFDILGMPAEAVAVLQNLVAQGAGLPIRHDLARRYWEQGKWDLVIPLLTDQAATAPDADPTLLGMKVMALENLRQKTQADAELAALKQRPEAIAQVWQLVIQKAMGAAIGDKDIVKQCRQALTLAPADPYVAYYLGEAYSRLGESELATGAWARASQERCTWPLPAIHLTDMLLQLGKPDEAIWVATSTARLNRNDLPTIIALARSWNATLDPNNPTEAKNLLNLVNSIQKQFPGEPQSAIIQIELLGRLGNSADAITAGKALLERKPPPDEHILMALASLSRRFNLGLSDATFALWENQYKITPNLAYAEAMDHALANHGDNGLSEFDSIAQRSGKADDLTWQLARARFLDASGNSTAAAAFKALSDAHPDDLNVQMSVATAQSTRGNWDIIPSVVDRLHAITGDEALTWQMLKARLEVESARNDSDATQGSLLLSNLIKRYPQLPELRILMAHALMRMKQPDGAVEQLKAASQADPNSVPISLELASAYQAQGDFPQVRQEVERIAPQLRTWSQRRGAASILAQSGAADFALSLMQRPGPTPPAGQDDLFMAMLYHQQHQNDKVEPILTRLLVKPDLATIQFAAGYYASLNRMDDARRVMSRLDSLSLSPGVKELVQGSFDFNTADIAGAIAEYQAATEKSPKNAVVWQTLAATQLLAGQRQQAIETLVRGAQANPANPGLQMLQANADLLRQGVQNDALQSTILSLIHRPLDSGASFDLLKLVADPSNHGDPQALASSLDSFIQQHPDCVGAYFCQIQAYRQINRYNDAISVAQRAIAAFPNDDSLARFAVELCTAAKRWNDLLSIAEAWKKRSGNNDADVAVATAMNGLGQFDDAVNVLAPYLPVMRDHPDQFRSVVFTYCESLANSNPKAAADLLWPLVEKEQPWRSEWISVALSLRDGTEARAWLDRVKAVIPDSAIRDRLALASAEMELSKRLGDTELMQESLATARQIADTAPADDMAQFVAGMQEESAGDLKTAESYYRRGVKINPASWLGDNNLAMVILKQNEDAKEALRFAAAAAAAGPQIGAVYDTYALAQSRTGDPRSAAATIRNALKFEPDNAAWRVRLIGYLLDSGQPVDAANALAAMETDIPDSSIQSADVRKDLAALRNRIRGAAGAQPMTGF